MSLLRSYVAPNRVIARQYYTDVLLPGSDSTFVCVCVRACASEVVCVEALICDAGWKECAVVT